jgi:hypothetical protein
MKLSLYRYCMLIAAFALLALAIFYFVTYAGVVGAVGNSADISPFYRNSIQGLWLTFASQSLLLALLYFLVAQHDGHVPAGSSSVLCADRQRAVAFGKGCGRSEDPGGAGGHANAITDSDARINIHSATQRSRPLDQRRIGVRNAASARLHDPRQPQRRGQQLLGIELPGLQFRGVEQILRSLLQRRFGEH